jgi:hypothetical protein
MDELAIIKSPDYYREFKKEDTNKDEEKIRRYTEAVRVTEELVWTDPNAKNAKRRKTLMLAPLMVLRYRSYKILEVQEEKDAAFVTVILRNLGLPGKSPEDLFELASGEDSSPVTFELIKTNVGWRIKDIEGIFNRHGL